MLPYALFEAMTNLSAKTVAIIVAHPDDETLWAGGAMLLHPSWQCFVVCLCRKSDEERAERFYNALKVLNSAGSMGDLDDGPEQEPLPEMLVESAVLNLLPPKHFDLIITHSPSGEYTKHLRHEETSKAVITLWNTGKIAASELWIFAYEDGDKAYYPQAVKEASIYQILTKEIWLKKYHVITDTYGFGKESWEAQTTPKEEAFWQFSNPIDAKKWLDLALHT
jgi:LmbE family N-acetylglucosaminyl deacetylase